MVWNMQKTQDLPEEHLLVSSDVLAIANISRRTLERWVASGKLPVIRREGLGYRQYRRRDLTKLITPTATDGLPVQPPVTEDEALADGGDAA